MCDRPLNSVTWAISQRRSGRGLQQAAKSFPAERTHFDKHPRLHPLNWDLTRPDHLLDVSLHLDLREALVESGH